MIQNLIQFREGIDTESMMDVIDNAIHFCVDPLLETEKQFARDAFDAGEEHDVSITRCCDINMPETNPDFSTYYKKYEY